MTATLVLATLNQDKIIELQRILAGGRVAAELVGLGKFPGAPDVAETGATFAANALLKAAAVAAVHRAAGSCRRFGFLRRRVKRDARRAVGPMVRQARG